MATAISGLPAFAITNINPIMFEIARYQVLQWRRLAEIVDASGYCEGDKINVPYESADSVTIQEKAAYDPWVQDTVAPSGKQITVGKQVNVGKKLAGQDLQQWERLGDAAIEQFAANRVRGLLEFANRRILTQLDLTTNANKITMDGATFTPSTVMDIINTKVATFGADSEQGFVLNARLKNNLIVDDAIKDHPSIEDLARRGFIDGLLPPTLFGVPFVSIDFLNYKADGLAGLSLATGSIAIAMGSPKHGEGAYDVFDRVEDADTGLVMDMIAWFDKNTDTWKVQWILGSIDSCQLDATKVRPIYDTAALDTAGAATVTATGITP